ncbi:MAG: prolipoprotein diacylglyceryl transferase [Acholeplasmatales bacterium]|nr:prolipoprotein diacylglyceryl transferase [Acholeplasmatales bacterium]
MVLFEAGLSIFGIRLYAICILMGIIVGVFMMIREGKRLGIYSDFIYYGVIITVPLAIVGARLWYILFNLDEGWTFSKIIGLDGGLAGLGIQGGVIVAMIVVYFWCRHKKMPLYRVIDIIAPALLIAQVFGRWGNFFNKELYGPEIKNVALFKALLPRFITDNMYILGKYRHPTFLYEGSLNLLGAIIMLVLRRKFKKLKSGDLMGAYLCWYGFVRIITETLRSKSGANEVLMIGGVYVSILLSAIFIALGLLFLILKRKFGPQDYYQDILNAVKKNRIDTVLFDLDGTLLDTKPLIDKSFIYTFQHFFPKHNLTDEELSSFFGPTLHDTFSRYSSDEAQIEEMISYYKKYNEENHTKESIKPFDGAVDMLKTLHRKGYKLGVVSSKRKDTILLGLDLYDMAKYFDVILGSDEVENPKPAPDGILKALELLKPEANVLYVGDNPSDIEAGINARVKTCDVMYSEKFEECEKLNPNYCVKDLSSIISILGE